MRQREVLIPNIAAEIKDMNVAVTSHAWRLLAATTEQSSRLGCNNKEFSVTRFLLAIAASLAIIGPASAATCTSTSNFSTISTPGLTVLGNGFGSIQHFSDCYTFTLDTPGSVSGHAWELDLSWVRNIDLTSVSLSGGSLPSTLVDTSPGSFSFGNLIAGAYRLIITGDVTGQNGGFLGGGVVGYGGLFTTAAVQAAPVPGPIAGAGLPGLLMALGGLIAWRRRRAAAA